MLISFLILSSNRSPDEPLTPIDSSASEMFAPSIFNRSLAISLCDLFTSGISVQLVLQLMFQT